MQIIIPMSGVGQRFINAGYRQIKPLIEIDGKPMVEHVCRLFPGEKDFVFICNQEHLDKTDLENTLKKIVPTGAVIGIPAHKKGPVYAVSQIFDRIKDEDEVIVNYCDFSKYWDYQDFLKQVRTQKADGAVCGYRGFHPHMLGTTNYAFMREEDNWMREIQEKKPFTDNRMQEYASDGTYYFRRGGYVKKYFQEILDKGPAINGEYYISVVYNYLVRDRLKVLIYEIEHMLQWGEPKDLREYNRWSKYFQDITRKKLPQQKIKNSLTLVPLAGEGRRFQKEGYTKPKPLIEVSGKPMVIAMTHYLPPTENHTFVCQQNHLKQFPLQEEIKKVFPQAKIVALDGLTEGQACSCEKGLFEEDKHKSLLIASSDCGIVFDETKFFELLNDSEVACIVFTFRFHSPAAVNPQMYGWVEVDQEDNIKKVSVKAPLSQTPYDDHGIIGIFFFRQAWYFLDAAQSLYKKNIRVNNEFYVDSCINEIVEMKLKAKILSCDHYISWGTPDELRTYEYWQRFFHKCSWHPYRLENDQTMSLDSIRQYEKV